MHVKYRFLVRVGIKLILFSNHILFFCSGTINHEGVKYNFTMMIDNYI